jgi:hypothetical protein
VSYHVRSNCRVDLRRLTDSALILIGENDEAIDPYRLKTLIDRKSPAARFDILPDVNHFAIFLSGTVHKIVNEWLMQRTGTGSMDIPTTVADEV